MSERFFILTPVSEQIYREEHQKIMDVLTNEWQTTGQIAKRAGSKNFLKISTHLRAMVEKREVEMRLQMPGLKATSYYRLAQLDCN